MLDRAKKYAPRRLLARCSLLLAAWLTIACSGSDEVNRHPSLGRLSLPLTTESRGSTYRLRGVFVIRSGTDTSGPSIAALSTDGNPDATVLSRRLAPGMYSVLLSQGWSLEKWVDAGWSAVNAALVGENPSVTEITAGSTSEVSFRFLVRGMASEPQGELTIGIDVEQESVCGNRVLEPAEVCDDGSNNGEPGLCDSSCKFVCTGACPLRVDPGAAPGGAGTSWDDPQSDIQAAIDQQAALGGGAVWVLAGDFTLPLRDDDVLLSLRSNVLLQGGFSGSETGAEQRDASGPRTTLRDPRETYAPSQYVFEVIEQDSVTVDSIHLVAKYDHLHVRDTTRLLFRNTVLERPSAHPASADIESSEVRIQESGSEISWNLQNSDLAFVDTTFVSWGYDQIGVRGSRVLLDRINPALPLIVGDDSDLVVKDTNLTQALERGGFITAHDTYGYSGPLSRITVMDSAAFDAGSAATPIKGGSLFVWNSSFVGLRGFAAGGSRPHAAAIESDNLEVALSTFFNNQCPFNSDGPCWFDVLTTETSLVHNSLFALADLEPMGPPDNTDLPNPILGNSRVTGNCVTDDRTPFVVEDAEVLALDHPCLDGGDAGELEASRQRLLARVALFAKPPFDIDVSRYQSPDWWKSSTVLEAKCTDDAAPDPGRHYALVCPPTNSAP